jgi:hypothetical protein
MDGSRYPKISYWSWITASKRAAASCNRNASAHTFLVAKFRQISHHYQQAYQAIEYLLHEPQSSPDPGTGYEKLIFRAQLFHFMGEVEAVFGIWLVPLFVAIIERLRGLKEAADKTKLANHITRGEYLPKAEVTRVFCESANFWITVIESSGLDRKAKADLRKSMANVTLKIEDVAKRQAASLYSSADRQAPDRSRSSGSIRCADTRGR